MARRLVTFALALVVIALVWKVFLGGSAETMEEIDRID